MLRSVALRLSADRPHRFRQRWVPEGNAGRENQSRFATIMVRSMPFGACKSHARKADIRLRSWNGGGCRPRVQDSISPASFCERFSRRATPPALAAKRAATTPWLRQCKYQRAVAICLLDPEAKSPVSVAPSRPTRGAYAQSSRNADRDAMDARASTCIFARTNDALPGEASWRRRVSRTAKSCGPDASTLASSFWEADASQG
jgi:hypothetical protein